MNKHNIWQRPLTSTLTIQSTYEEKKLIKNYNKISVSDWIPGINLVTFKMCSGIYPSHDILSKGIVQLKDVVHTDWLVHNMVIQGNTVTMIDCHDPRHEQPDGSLDVNAQFNDRRKRMLFKILEWLKIENTQDLILFFKRKNLETR